MMKYITFLGFTLFCSLFSGYSIAAHKNAEPLDRIVAVVNDTVVTQSELHHDMDLAKKQMTASNVPLPEQDQLRKQVLDQLINKKLQLQLAEQTGIRISDSDVDKAIQTIAKNNKITVGELYEKLNAEGFNVHDYRAEIQEAMTIQGVQQRSVGAKITITPEEIRDFTHSKAWRAYNNKEYHLEDLLINLPDTASSHDIENAKKRAELLLTKLHQGLSFHDATSESGEQSNMQGGDLGWRKLPEIPAAFSNEILSMKKGDIAGPIQAPNGFHLIHLADIRDAATGQMNATQKEKQIQQLIYQKKMEEGIQSWISKIRSEAFINMHPTG